MLLVTAAKVHKELVSASHEMTEFPDGRGVNHGWVFQISIYNAGIPEGYVELDDEYGVSIQITRYEQGWRKEGLETYHFVEKPEEVPNAINVMRSKYEDLKTIWAKPEFRV